MLWINLLITHYGVHFESKKCNRQMLNSGLTYFPKDFSLTDE